MNNEKTLRGIFYGRRSTDKQEVSLKLQLEWARKESERLGIPLSVGELDLSIESKLPAHPSPNVFLDDDESGYFLERPGLQALKREVERTGNVTHLFVYHRDRLSRSQDVHDVLEFEVSLRRRGVNLVLLNGIAAALSGRLELGDLMTLTAEYHESGEFSRRLAGRIIRKQLDLANEGASIGGRAPYGFGRFIVGPDGIPKKLDDGVTMRAAGHRVVWLPVDEDKLAVCKKIIAWTEEGWGIKRIAKKLNEDGVPSPDAGRTRTDNGVSHEVSGKWHASTVSSLLNNPLIAGVKVYGARSEGKILRWGSDGARETLPDEISTGKRKGRMLSNGENVKKYIKQHGFDAQITEARFQALQEQGSSRSTSQRGIPRTRDLAGKPPSTRVVDLTNGCGAPMYAGATGKKQIYVCSAYNQDPSSCSHNWVECEPLLDVTLRSIKHLVSRTGSREKLIQALRQRAAAIDDGSYANALREIQSLQSQLEILEREKKTIAGKMAVETDAELESMFRQQFATKRSEISVITTKLERLRQSSGAHIDPATIASTVDRAEQLLDDLPKLATNPEMREKIHPMLVKLGIMVGVDCIREPWGERKRTRVRRGVIAFGNAPLPTPIYGNRNRKIRKASGGEGGQSNQAESETDPSPEQESSQGCAQAGHRGTAGNGKDQSKYVSGGRSIAHTAASESNPNPDDQVAEIVGETANKQEEAMLSRKVQSGSPRLSLSSAFSVPRYDALFAASPTSQPPGV